MFVGVATAGTMTDVFMEYSYIEKNSTTRALTGQAQNMVNDTCGVRPSGTNRSVDASFYYHLSPLRFYPTNFSGIRMWLAAGGADTHAPDEVHYFPQYLELNNTVINSTCHFVAKFGEPGGCTTTLHTLHVANAALYQYRFNFNQGLGHTIGQLVPASVFDFWTSRPTWSLGAANGHPGGTHIIGENIWAQVPSSIGTGYNYRVVLSTWATSASTYQFGSLNFQFEAGYQVFENGTVFPYYGEGYSFAGPYATDPEGCAHPQNNFGSLGWSGAVTDFAHPLTAGGWYNFTIFLEDNAGVNNEVQLGTTYYAGSTLTTLSDVVVNDTALSNGEAPTPPWFIDYPTYLQNGGSFVCGGATEQVTTFTEDVFTVNGTIAQPPSIVKATAYGITELPHTGTSIWIEGPHLWNASYTENTVPTGVISEVFNASTGHRDIQIDNAPWVAKFYGVTSENVTTMSTPPLNVTFSITLLNSTAYSWSATNAWTNATAAGVVCGHNCTGSGAKTGSYLTVSLQVSPVRTIYVTVYLLLESTGGLYGYLASTPVTFVYV